VRDLRESSVDKAEEERSSNVKIPRCNGWQPGTRHRSLQTSVARLCFAALVIQPPLQKQFSGLVVGHGNLLVACVKITSYDYPAAAGSAPFSEPWSLALPSLLGGRSRQRHLISLPFRARWVPGLSAFLDIIFLSKLLASSFDCSVAHGDRRVFSR
jgi:hypothetical protein